MLALIWKYPEILPLTLNSTTTIIYMMQGNVNKAIYWFGATILTLGLLRMRG